MLKLQIDHVIANLNGSSGIEIRAHLLGPRLCSCRCPNHGRRGRAYNRAVVLDASYGPVRRVAYKFDGARVEQRTDLDKLIIELETMARLTQRKPSAELQLFYNSRPQYSLIWKRQQMTAAGRAA